MAAISTYAIDPPQRITKVDLRLQQSSYGMGALVMSLPFIGVGLFFAYAGFIDPDLLDDVNGPLWVLGFVGLSFAMAGLVLFLTGLRGALWHSQTARDRRRYPDQPWRFDYPWQAGGISDSAAERIVTGIAGVLLVGVFLVPFVWWAFLSRESSLGIQIGVSLFLLLWVLGLLTLGYRSLQFIKYGATYLDFSEFPFKLGGTLMVGLANTRFRSLAVTLRFVEEKFVDRGTAQRRAISHECYQHYSETRQLELSPGEFARVSFQLPDDQKFTTRLVADPAIGYWELVVESDMPGIDFRTTFPLPVYPGPFSSQPNASFGRMSRGRRWVRGVPFESKLVLIPLLLLGGIYLVAPDWTKQALNRSLELGHRISTIAALRPVDDISSSAMCLVEAKGSVWALAKYDLTEFPGADPELPVSRLTQELYRAQFNTGLNAVSTLLVRENGELWIGGWHGEILVFRDGNWQQLVGREKTPLDRIYHLVEFNGEVFVSSRGMWHWDASANELAKVAGTDGVVELLVADQAIYFSDDSEIGRYDGQTVVQLFRHDAEITALTLDINGRFLIGGKNGLGIYTADGELVGSQLDGRHITRITVSARGEVVAGTLHSGVMVRTRNSWYQLDQSNGLPEKHVTDVLIDSQRRLWVAMYGGGVSSILVDRLLAE